MKPKFIFIASALLLMSNIAIAHELKEPSAGAQEQQAPTAKMTGEDVMGHMCPGKKGHGMRGMMRHGMHMRLIFILMDTDGDGRCRSRNSKRPMQKFSRGSMPTRTGRLHRRRCRCSLGVALQLPSQRALQLPSESPQAQ